MNRLGSNPANGPGPQNRRFEMIDPPGSLRERVSYVNRKPGSETLAEAAERAVRQLEYEFDDWRMEMLDRLSAAWLGIQQDPADATNFQAFHHVIHEVSGNASLLDRAAAGQIASPIARLLERSPDIRSHLSIIALAIASIEIVMRQGIAADEDGVVEIVSGLQAIVERWVQK